MPQIYTSGCTVQCDDGHRIQVCADKGGKQAEISGILTPPAL